MKILSEAIAGGADAVYFMHAMRKISLFSFFTDEQLRKLLTVAKTAAFAAGETVFAKGDPGDSLFVVRKGKVEAKAKGFFGMKTLKAMGPEEVFGLLGLTLKKPRAATIVAAEPTTCFILMRSDIDHMIERDPDMASAFKKVLNDRFAKRD